MAAHGIRVAEASHVHGGEAATLQTQLTQRFRQRGRLVAKPTADGSSIGLFHLTDEAVIESAARAIAAAGIPYLIEDFIQGTELTVGVIDDGDEAVSLPASEVRVEQGRAFDFEGKYLGRGTREITPAELPEDLTRVVRATAVTAHRALGCYGYSRTDLIANDRSITFLETNTLPGLTRTSFIPQQLEADHRSLAGFLERQLALAIARRDRS
jgi:D-alanine-D-alanine ligase